MSRYTKIICTLGPASMSEAMIVKMSRRGMNVIRINTSHGDEDQHQKIVDLVRSVSKKHELSLKLLLDLEGYRLRVGKMKRNVRLEVGKDVFFVQGEKQMTDDIPLDFDEDLKSIVKGANIYIDDGNLHLRATNVSAKSLRAKVIQGGILKERKGVNIPGLKLQANILTEKDKSNIQFAIKNKVEFVAHSFVRNKKDIQKVVELVRPHLPRTKVIAKIESEDGVYNVESIISACDGVMVARGDLGVSIPIWKVPIVQKYIIAHCNRKKKLSITATQMLDSMIENGRPTRAEVSDVANAILDGSDFVMLSGETAVGKYPSRSVQIMSQIVEYTEKCQNVRPK